MMYDLAITDRKKSREWALLTNKHGYLDPKRYGEGWKILGFIAAIEGDGYFKSIRIIHRIARVNPGGIYQLGREWRLLFMSRHGRPRYELAFEGFDVTLLEEP